MILFNLLVCFILGLIIGSFLSVLISRLHSGEKGILVGRSHCPKCKKTLKANDLIPLVSYLATKGKCRYCKKEISPWYPMLELSTGITFGVLYLYSLDPITWAFQAILFTVLLFIFFYDIKYQEIHDAVMLPAILFALIYSLIFGDVISSLIGAGIAVGFFGLQYVVSRGKWIGSGDLRIGAFLGLMLGWEQTILAIVSAYIIGSIVGIFLLTTKKVNRNSAVPLGPFLVIGTTISFFYGHKLIEWYLNLLLL
ncbi:prepilin peptidase [Patescibacteria group bacterium]|nr:prepilin peptidase [Patescibacteria group bacterium]